MSEFDVILDKSRQNIKEIPEKILKLFNLRMLYLEGNRIEVLPDEFFSKLYKLTWLDLRNNQLKLLPTSIGKHQHLENLLLSDNQIQKLPNELGLVKTLKVLQLQNNPLTYPNRIVMAQGTKAICHYLRIAFERDNMMIGDSNLNSEYHIPDDYTNDFINIKNKSGNVVTETTKKINNNDVEIIHKMSKDSSKLSLASKTSINISTIGEKENNEDALKDVWLKKIQTILTEQEKILQREKDIGTLKSWRNKRYQPAPTSNTKIETPYGTYPEYDTMPSRQDLENPLDTQLTTHSSLSTRRVDVDGLIKQLATQLQNIETQYNDTESSSSEINEVGQQIKTILAIHKKLKDIKSDDAINTKYNN